MSRAAKAATSPSLRERLRTQLADLKMPGALEALDDVLRRCDSGHLAPADAIEQLLGAHIQLRNARRLQTAMRSARLPAVKTLADFDFIFNRASSASRSRASRRSAFSNAKRMSSCLAHPASARRTWP
jgi:DNA replication protein DnaC